MQPTGTEYICNQPTLLSTNGISKAICETAGRIRGEGLAGKSIRGVMALGVGTVVGLLMKSLRYMILARLLAKDAFGLLAIVYAVGAALEAFAEVGVKQSVIQNKQGAQYEYLNVAWWMQAVRAAGLFALAMALAPWISRFYGKEQLLGLLRVSFLAILFKGLVSPRAYVLEKEFRFGRAVLLSQGSAILATVITVAAALVFRNVWVLVIGFVVEAGLLCLLSYVLVPFLPALRVDRRCLRELLRFARGMVGLPVLAMISFQTDVLVLGKCVSDEQLGMYYLAVTLVSVPMDLFSRIIGPVLLPAFVERQAEAATVSRMVLKIAAGTAAVGLPLVVFLASCAGPILTVVYTASYAAAAVPFALLCGFVFIYAQSVIFGQLYMGLGRPDLHRGFNIVRVVIMLSLIYPAIVYFKLSGAAAVVLLANLGALCFQVYWVRRLIEIRVGGYIRSYVPGLVPAGVVLAGVGLLRLTGIASAPVLVAAGCLILAAVLGTGFYYYLAGLNNK
jgi:O-antigen/teichoic acid export membrane protein